MCGTGPSKEIVETGNGGFKEQGLDGRRPAPAPWRSQSRFNYDQKKELEGQQRTPNEQDDRDISTDFYKNLSHSDKNAVKGFSETKQNQIYLNNGSSMTMLVGADHYLQDNDILEDFPDLSLAKNHFGEVRFETRSRKSSVRSSDILVVSFSTNLSIFHSGVDDKYKRLAGESLFRDREFPPELKSLVGYGVDQNNQTLPGTNKYM